MAEWWTEEEISFLKFAYPNKDFTDEEISVALNKTHLAIKNKAFQIGVKRYKEPLPPEGFKRCTKCGMIQPATKEFFYRNRKHKDCLEYHCKICDKTRKHENQTNSGNEVISGNETISGNEVKKCIKCGEEKNILDFHKDSNNKKDGRKNTCKSCVAKYHRKWYIKGGY